MRAPLIIATCAVLAACGGDPALKNPESFTAQTKDGLTTGTYNPAGWTSENIQKFLCDGDAKPTGYAEKQLENGLIAFSARCV